MDNKQLLEELVRAFDYYKNFNHKTQLDENYAYERYKDLKQQAMKRMIKGEN